MKKEEDLVLPPLPLLSEVGGFGGGTEDKPIVVTRPMTPDPETGMPKVGDTGRYLAVREGTDFKPDSNGIVTPTNGNGLSVVPPGGQYNRFLLGNLGKGDIPYSLDVSQLPPGLQYTPDPENPLNHGFIGPSVPMPIDELRDLIIGTQPIWRRP